MKTATTEIAEDFMAWQQQWDKYYIQGQTKRPPSLDEFIASLDSRYIIKRRIDEIEVHEAIIEDGKSEIAN